MIDVKCSQVGQAIIPTVFSRACYVQTSIIFKPGVLKLSSFTSSTKGTEGNGIHLTLNPLPDEAKRDKKWAAARLWLLGNPITGKFYQNQKSFLLHSNQILMRFKQKNQRIPRFKNVLDLFNPRILVLNLFLSKLTYSPQRCRNKSLEFLQQRG